jgi:hypothetical protein
MIYVCKQEDYFIEDKARWVVDLSNGERIWQDDNRPGVTPASAWLRLQDYIEYTHSTISNMFIQFRSHLEFPLLKNAAGYFFAKGYLASSDGYDTMGLLVVGYLQDDKVYISQWDTPALTLVGTEIRTLHQILRTGKEHLIINGIPTRNKLLSEWAD